MQREWLTEYEWRTQNVRKPKRPDWWGAQCMYPKRRMIRNRGFQRGLMTVSLAAALMLPFAVPVPDTQDFAVLQTGQQPMPAARSVNAIAYRLPGNRDYQQQIFPRSKLLRGKLLVISPQHPLPDDLPAPNTASVAQKGNGMIPVRSLQVRTGYETIDALKQLFEQLRSEGIEGLYVQQGMMSRAQQTDALLRQMRTLMKTSSIAQAQESLFQTAEPAGTGSLLLEYAVEISPADGSALETSPQGQRLLQLCWRYGFVRESAQRPFRFRYVGKAHATAMTYLDLDLESYLAWMRRKEVLVVSAGGVPQYLILCKPMQGDYAAFDLPVGAACEISMDNTGYALAACTL